jgi:hypothetical protein
MATATENASTEERRHAHKLRPGPAIVKRFHVVLSQSAEAREIWMRGGDRRPTASGQGRSTVRYGHAPVGRGSLRAFYFAESDWPAGSSARGPIQGPLARAAPPAQPRRDSPHWIWPARAVLAAFVLPVSAVPAPLGPNEGKEANAQDVPQVSTRAVCHGDPRYCSVRKNIGENRLTAKRTVAMNDS